ncbi:hypothetical protein BDR26DRAFT_937150 [Obelidium mucronatum]|nr:hypothetical protein BDR26DRAFT_937150 [Obelidium mucronatum]
MSAFWYAPPLTPTENSATKAYSSFNSNSSTNENQPSHYQIPLLVSPSFPPKRQESLPDTDSMLTQLLSNLTTDQSHFPTLAPFSTPETNPSKSGFHFEGAPNGTLGMNEDLMLFKKKGSQEQFGMSSLDLCASTITTTTTTISSSNSLSGGSVLDSIDLSPLKNSLPIESPFIPALPSRINSDRITNTALEVMKMSMMALSMRDEEVEYDEEWKGYSQAEPVVTSAARRRRSRGVGACTAIHQRRGNDHKSYVYDSEVRRNEGVRSGGGSWRQQVPRTVCTVGMQIDSAGVLRDDHESKVRRRHPYYRPPSASHYGRTGSPTKMEVMRPGEVSYQGSDGAYGVYHSDVY